MFDWLKNTFSKIQNYPEEYSMTFREANQKNMPKCTSMSKILNLEPILYAIWTEPEFGDIADEQPFVIAVSRKDKKEFDSYMQSGNTFELDARFFEGNRTSGSIKGTLSPDDIHFIKKYDILRGVSPVKYEGKKDGEIYRGDCIQTYSNSWVARFVLADSPDKLKLSGRI